MLKFEPQGTPATLKFGFTSGDGEFHSLVALDKAGAWVGPLKKDADRLGTDAMLAFRKGTNQFAHFILTSNCPDSLALAARVGTTNWSSQ